MNLAFLLHFYQPPTQSELVFKTIAKECYIPLLRTIKAKSACAFSVNTPLSFLELLHKYGYVDLLEQFKELLEGERIELTGSAAYHPLLTKVPEELATKQIILNEYGLGYYFGQQKGFEGESAMLIKEIKGFFPPELAVNSSVLQLLTELNYDWVVAEKFSVREKERTTTGCVYRVGDAGPKIVVRDINLSNMISFKRDETIDDITAYLRQLKQTGSENIVVALDAETFGHHNPYGISLLSNLVGALADLEIHVTRVSDIVDSASTHPITDITESTWAMQEADPQGSIYALWQNETNTVHRDLWQLEKEVLKDFSSITPPKIPEGYENVPIWVTDEITKIAEPEVAEYLNLALLIYKSMHSDKYWWASNQTIHDKVLYSPLMIKNALDMYKNITQSALMVASRAEIEKTTADIERQLV